MTNPGQNPGQKFMHKRFLGKTKTERFANSGLHFLSPSLFDLRTERR
jgi:hypothetical protein